MRIDYRDLAMPDGLQEILRKVTVAHRDENVLDPQPRGDVLRVRAFVEPPILEFYAESLERPGPGVHHRSKHGRRIDAPRKVSIDGTITVQPDTDRLVEDIHEFVRQLFQRPCLPGDLHGR